jgi:plasminogen activator inhibitor 1 RNA-binding protein
LKTEQEAMNVATVEEGAVEAIRKEEEEDSEMTLEEYEKVLEQKRMILHAEKASERKVEVDKAFEKMQLVDNKKREEDIFIKLGHDKEKVKRDAAEREEKVRKPVSINEFLKPAEGEKYYGPPSNRGRGGRGGRGERREGVDRREGGGRTDRESSRGSFSGGRVGGSRGPYGLTSAPKIEDQSQFPTLGAK